MSAHHVIADGRIERGVRFARGLLLLLLLLAQAVIDPVKYNIYFM